MGPRPLGRGRWGRRPELHSASVGGGGGRASMGPRPLGRGRLPTPMPVSTAPMVLQWGHGLSAVEDCPLPMFDPPTPPAASMGPRPLGRGRCEGTGPLACGSCFNGATACRPWKPADVPSTRSFNGATSCRTWKRLSLTRVKEQGRTETGSGQRQLQWGHVLSDVETGWCAEDRV